MVSRIPRAIVSIRWATTWRTIDPPLAPPWQTIATAVTSLIRRVRARRRPIRVSCVSIEWRRAYEIESSKHRDDS